MEDDPGAADDERTIELSSIAAIFPEILLDPDSPYKASLNIPVSPAVPLKIQFQQLADSSVPDPPTPPTSTEPEAEGHNTAVQGDLQRKHGEQRDVHSLVHLPPVNLKICLPDGYPGNTPPLFALSSSPAWIPEDTLQKLIQDGSRLWEEQGRDQVIFTYIDHLQQAAEAGFDLANDLARDVTLSSDLKIALLDYDLRAKRDAFEKETFECGICLEPKKGTVCHRLLLCSHVFCVECLQECYNKCISEGDVDNVKCLHPGCGKAPRMPPGSEQPDPAKRMRRHDPTLNPSELLQIPLSEEVVQRYVHLKRKKRLESDKNTVYCPRQWCQGAARSKKYPKPIDPMHDVGDVNSDSDAEVQNPSKGRAKSSTTKENPMSERLCICEDCGYAFCSVCRKGWHGELTSYILCNPRSEKELNEEEKATADYLALHSTPCPTCAAPCQKTMGCNHMICFKCRTHFCYLCSSYLMESNPYQHFNDKHNPCYMRLWELEEGDDENAQVVAWELPPDDEAFESDSDADSSEDELDIRVGNFGHEPAPNLNWHFQPRDPHGPVSDDEDEGGREPVVRAPPEPADFRIEIVNFAREGAANQGVHHIHVVEAPLPLRQAPPPPAPAPPHRGRGARPPPRGRGGAARGRGAQNQIQNQNPGRGRGRGRGRGAAAPALPGAHPRDLVLRPVRPQPALNPPPNPAIAAAEPNNNDDDNNPNPDPNSDSDSSSTEDEVPLRFPRAAPPPAPAPAPAPGQGNVGQQQPAMLRHMGIDRFLQLAEQDQEDEWDSDELEDEMEDQMDVRRRRAARRIWG